jgi:hypothetical protein
MSTISSGTTLTTALVQTGDTTGDLVIKTGSSNTTAMTVSGTDQSVTLVGSLTANTNASTITTGTVPTARLATGTANSSTYLRGDQTWAAIASSQWVTSGSNISYTTGSVGIGTSSPTGRLDVSSSSAGVTAGDFVVDTANKIVYVGRLSSTSGDNAKLVVRNRVGDALTITGDTTADGTGLFRPGTSILGFSTASVERMRIAADGTVTIGGNNILGVGIGQSWTNVGGSRSSGTTYTNSTGRPIQLMVATDNTGNTNYGSGGSAKFFINGNNVGEAFCSNAANVGGLFQAIIPPSSTYQVSASIIRSWWELR